MKKKIIKGLAITALAAVTMLGVTSCGDTAQNETVQIAIGVQQTSGNNYESMKNFLDDIKDDLNFEYETVLLESRNNDKNLTTFQTKMLTGINGIISMVDMDAANTKKLLEDCEKNDVYYAGYMSDFANAQTDETIMTNERLLGTVSDGEIDGSVRGQFLFDQIVKTTKRKVVFSRFPLYAYPSAATAISKFKELAATYNETHEDKFTYYTEEGNANADTYEFGFTTPSLPDAELTKWNNAGVEAVVAVNSLGKRLITTFAAANLKDRISIYTLGWEDNIIDDFGDDKCIKTLGQTPAETIMYPLIRIINAARGYKYTDEPTTAEEKIAVGQYTYLASTADLADGRENSMNFSVDHTATRALIKGDKLKTLLAENGGTHASLLAELASWDSDYALRRE